MMMLIIVSGEGSLIDFTNPAALDWLHAQVCQTTFYHITDDMPRSYSHVCTSDSAWLHAWAGYWWLEGSNCYRLMLGKVDSHCIQVDGTDPYILEIYDPQSYNGKIDYRSALASIIQPTSLNDDTGQCRQYADAFYGDFFNYTRAFVIYMEVKLMISAWF